MNNFIVIIHPSQMAKIFITKYHYIFSKINNKHISQQYCTDYIMFTIICVKLNHTIHRKNIISDYLKETTNSYLFVQQNSHVLICLNIVEF